MHIKSDVILDGILTRSQAAEQRSLSVRIQEEAAICLMAKTFGNTGRCVEVKKVRLYTPCFAGDYMEYIAGIRKQEGNKVLIEVRSFKIIEVPTDPPYPSSIDVLEDPPLSTVVQFWYEY